MPPSEPTIAEDWYRLSFDALYPIIYAHRTVEAAHGEALFSMKTIGVSPSDVVLDLCCGNGRHMAHCAEVAGTVVGLDYSADLLRLARETLGPRAKLTRGDMRRLPFEECFDVVMNYFTSFGYFVSEEENHAVVRGVARALKPGGRFFIDYLRRDYVEAHVVPRSSRWEGDYEIREARWLDAKCGRINKAITLFRGGEKVHESGESVRLYGQDEFVRLLEQGGLSVDGLYGDYGGAPCGATHPRMIVVGRRAD